MTGQGSHGNGGIGISLKVGLRLKAEIGMCLNPSWGCYSEIPVLNFLVVFNNYFFAEEMFVFGLNKFNTDFFEECFILSAESGEIFLRLARV